jgi:hypothetical protein
MGLCCAEGGARRGGLPRSSPRPGPGPQLARRRAPDAGLSSLVAAPRTRVSARSSPRRAPARACRARSARPAREPRRVQLGGPASLARRARAWRAWRYRGRPRRVQVGGHVDKLRRAVSTTAALSPSAARDGAVRRHAPLSRSLLAVVRYAAGTRGSGVRNWSCRTWNMRAPVSKCMKGRWLQTRSMSVKGGSRTMRAYSAGSL